MISRIKYLRKCALLTKCCKRVGEFAGQKDSDILLYFVHHLDFRIALVGGTDYR